MIGKTNLRLAFLVFAVAIVGTSVSSEPIYSAPPSHYDDISTFGPATSNRSGESSFALQALELENDSPDIGQIEGRVGDGMIRLTWTSGSGGFAGYRIYRRDYGPSQHYGLRATLGAGISTFEDPSLDNGLPYYYKIVPALADGNDANMIGEVTLCPMRAPVWKYVSPEPVIAAVDTGVTGANSASRPGSYGWGLGFSVSEEGHTVIKQAPRTSFYSDCLENPTSGIWVDRGNSASWDGDSISDPEIWGSYIIYSGFDGTTWRIGRITPGAANRSMILDVGPNSWDSVHVRDPYVANGGNINELYYSGFDGLTWQIGRATMSGSAWVKDSHNPVLSPGLPGEWDSGGVFGAYVTVERLYPKLYVMYYTGTDGVKDQIGYATSPDGVHWSKHIDNPVLPAGVSGSWCSAGVGHPTGYDFNGETHLWFEGTDGTNTAIGRAIIRRSRIFGQHTAIFGPEWFEKTAEYYNVPTIYDALYDLLIELHGFPAYGADYQVMSYYSRAIGVAWNGNPYTQGIGWYSIFDYPSYPRVGSYFPAVFAHESGHNFGYYIGGTLGAIVSGNNNDYHGLAGVFESYTLEKLAANYDKWGLTQEQIVQVISDANARRNSDIFRILATEYGWGIWEAFFQACRPGIIPNSISQSANTSAKKNTLMICMLSVASQTDLRLRFRQEPKFTNEIDDGFYNTIYPAIASAMAGERESPSPPSSLTALLKQGPCVKLNWSASSSSDINHYNVYCDSGSGAIDYLSPFGVTAAPWDTSWTSPVLEGNRLYLFAIRAVDHWGNEEKNTSAVVSVFVPQSPASFIRDWLLLGPFSSSGISTDHTVTGEAQLNPYPGQIEGTDRWRRAWTPSDLEDYLPSVNADMMDLNRILNNPSYCNSYAFTRVFSPSKKWCYLRVTHDDDCRIWLNGVQIYNSGITGSEISIPVMLNAGWNRLCLKICNYGGPYWFTARFCDAEGGEVPGVTWSVDATSSTPVVTVSQTELAFNDVRIGQDDSLSVNILNRGTAALVLSNIEIQGESASDFQCPAQTLDLAAGTGSQLIVSFEPNTVGAKIAELVATTNDPNLPTFIISLSGLGRSNALYVNDESSSGDVFTMAIGNDQNSGLDTGSPLRSLSTAIERFALQDGDVIYVDSSIYSESVSVFSTDHEFTIHGAGKDLTIIDGSGIAPCLTFNAVTDATIEQLTLQNGKGLSFEDGTHGGALLTEGSRILIRDAVLKNSTARWGGGALLDRGDAKLLNVTISGNTADIGGGVLFELAGTMQQCDVVSNQAWYGGGLYLYGGGKCESCTITGNTGKQDGGAAYFYGNGGVLENSTASLNGANYGGGLYFYYGGKAQHCEIQANTANFDGGGVFYCGGGSVQYCDIESNRANNQGGGLLFKYGGGIAQNCLIHKNLAGSVGGGAFLWGCGTMQNCTIVGDSAISYGGGLYCVNGGSIENTIMYSNRAPKGSNYFNDGQGWSYSYCRATPKVPNGLGNIDADPHFADSGYWDPNGTIDALDDDFWVDGDYHLKSHAGRWDPKTERWVRDNVTSQCIDTGDPNSDWTAELWPHGRRINMGAYGGTPEASMSLSIVGNPADYNNDGVVDAQDVLILSQEWLNNHLPLAADINRDAKVDWVDFAIMASDWLEDSGE